MVIGEVVNTGSANLWDLIDLTHVGVIKTNYTCPLID